MIIFFPLKYCGTFNPDVILWLFSPSKYSDSVLEIRCFFPLHNNMLVFSKYCLPPQGKKNYLIMNLFLTSCDFFPFFFYVMLQKFFFSYLWNYCRTFSPYKMKYFSKWRLSPSKLGLFWKCIRFLFPCSSSFLFSKHCNDILPSLFMCVVPYLLILRCSGRTLINSPHSDRLPFSFGSLWTSYGWCLCGVRCVGVRCGCFRGVLVSVKNL